MPPDSPCFLFVGETVGEVVSLTEKRKMRFLDWKNEKNEKLDWKNRNFRNI